MKRTLSLVVWSLFFCALVPGLALAQSAGWPRTVTDDMGNAIKLAKKPQRIVSVTLPTDEILLSLVSKDRIVAVTGFSTDPAVSNVASQVADIPTKLPQLNVEVITSLAPDLVFVADWSDAGSVSQLRNAGLAVYQFKSPVSIKQIEDGILHIAASVGEEQAGQQLVQGMESRLAAVARKVSTLPASARLTVIDYNTYGTASGVGSSWDEIVRLAGLKNAVGDLTADQYGSVPLSREKLLTVDPDILMLPSWVYGDPKGSDAFYTSIVNDPALRGLKAVKEGRVHRMPESIKTSTSQYIVAAVEDLARYAYPDLFK